MDSHRSLRKRDTAELASGPAAPQGAGGTIERHQPAVIFEKGVLVSYLRVLNRNRWTLIVFCICGLALGLLSTAPVAPKFRAHTVLDVQSLNENFMNLRAVDPSGASGTYSAESNLQTSIKLVTSEELLSRVVRSMKTTSNENVPKKDWFSVLNARLGIWPAATVSRANLIEKAAKEVKVKPIGLTRLIDIECESTDPQVASQFCNSLAKDYVDQDFESRAETAQQTNTWLARQLADVRRALEDKETRLLAYARDNAILFNQQTDSVNQEKLKQDQLELSRAQADRITKQSTNDLLTQSNPDSLPPVLDSGPLKEYQEKLTELLREKANALSVDTPNHPKVVRLQAQIDALQASIESERANILMRIRNDFTAAQAREKLLETGYVKQEQIVAGEVAKEGQFNILRHEVDSERGIYDSLMQHVREAGLLSMMRTSPVRIVDRAITPQIPFAPNRATTGAVGLILGGLFGVGLIFWNDRTRPKLRAPGDARTWFGARELGVIPSSRADSEFRPRTGIELVTFQNQHSLLAESYRSTMNSVLFGSSPGRLASVLVITSPGAGEGKTSLTCNLGIALAETQKRVVLIDGDMRRPRLHKVFELSNDLGLNDILASDRELREYSLHEIAKPTKVRRLSVVTSGSKGGTSISALLHSGGLEKLLDMLRRECDIILIDTPPLLHISDARVMGRRADGTILVFRSGVTTSDSARAVREVVMQDGVRVLGTVLNDFNPASEGLYSYYKSYYAYRT